MGKVSDWLVPLLSFGVFALALLAYVILELLDSSKGSGELLTAVQTALGATIGSGATATKIGRSKN